VVLEDIKWEILAGWNLSNQIKARKELLANEIDKVLTACGREKKVYLLRNTV